MATRTVSFVGFNRALIAAKEDVGPETSSAKQSCFGSALSRRKSVFLVTFVTTDKSNPKRSGRIKTIRTAYPQRNNVQAKIYAVVLGEVPGRLLRI